MNPPTKPKPTTKTTDTRYRVIRGGSWDGRVAAGVRAANRAANRDGDAPSYRSRYLGFRCALRGREPRV